MKKRVAPDISAVCSEAQADANPSVAFEVALVSRTSVLPQAASPIHQQRTQFDNTVRQRRI